MGKDIELWRKKKMRKAVEIKGRIKPRVVSRRCAMLNILNRGIMRVAKGIIMERSNTDIIRSLFLSRYI
jgi:hypothetical protein